MTIKLFTET